MLFIIKNMYLILLTLSIPQMLYPSSNNTAVASIQSHELLNQPVAITSSPDGSIAYVVNQGNNTLTLIDTNLNFFIATSQLQKIKKKVSL